MKSITRRISRYNHSNGNNIKYIVMHGTGNYKDTASANANYFNTGDRQASAHYFVDENSIWQVVEDYKAAWHCGDGDGRYGISNHNSISIEMCNSGGYVSENTIKNALELVKYLQNKYNVPNSKVVRHYDASRKICPNNMSSNNWAKWKEFKSRLGGTAVSTPTTSSGAGKCNYSVKQVQKMLIKIGYPVGRWGADGIWGDDTENAVICFQRDCNMSATGTVDQATYRKITAEYNKKMGKSTPKPTPKPSSNNNGWVNLDGKTGTVVASGGLNVREKKSTSSRILGALPDGKRIKLYRKEGDWIHIYYPPHGAYVYGKYVRY